MKMLTVGMLLLMMMGCFVGCVTRPDVRTDTLLRKQAMEAFEAGNYGRVRMLVERAETCYVPRSELWRRTMELRVALAEGTQQGELRRFLRAWGEQRKDWSVEDWANAELTLAATLTPAFAADWLYDLDSSSWSPALKTRYNLLLAKLQSEHPTLRDDATTRWLVGVRGIYEHGDVAAAAKEAFRCAHNLQSAHAALIAAKLYNEIGYEGKKEEALLLAITLSDDGATQQEVTLIRSAPLGTRSSF